MDACKSSASYAKLAEQRHLDSGGISNRKQDLAILFSFVSSLWPRIVVIVYGRYIGQCLDADAGPVSLLLPPICRIG